MKPAKKNKASAYQHLAIIDYYFSFELSVGHVAGLFPLLLLPNLHVNIAGLTPKKGQPNKWRLILVTSSPFGFSVDDGIRPEDFPFQYIHVDDIINVACKYCRGALMAKFDVKSVYQNVAIYLY